MRQGNLTKNAQTTPALKTASYRGAVYLTTLVKKHNPPHKNIASRILPEHNIEHRKASLELYKNNVNQLHI